MIRISQNHQPVCYNIKSKNPDKISSNQEYPVIKSGNPFGLLGFTGNPINTDQAKGFDRYYPETYKLIDFLSPQNLKIRENERITLNINDKDIKLIFNPLKCDSIEESYKIFSIGLYTAIKRAETEGISKIPIEINDPDGGKYARVMGFKTTDMVNDKITMTLSKESFPKTIEKIEKLIQEIHSDHNKFKFKVISLPDFNFHPIIISPEMGLTLMN
ncbi:MAG: hypothetical protein A2287_07755 [Candidatus Melainabacteria bacterium RIFOXYA12_FULL_32_12]|nr:MAG: hypothetical protein A2287_07755 [Candidatus Melainabacteria bacterium RIFOXYA12_FULL_32_12]